MSGGGPVEFVGATEQPQPGGMEGADAGHTDEGLPLRFAVQRAVAVLNDERLVVSWPWTASFLCLLYECFHGNLTNQLETENAELLKMQTGDLAILAKQPKLAKRRMFVAAPRTLADCFFVDSMEARLKMSTKELLAAITDETSGEEENKFLKDESQFNKGRMTEQVARDKCIEYYKKKIGDPAGTDLQELRRILEGCYERLQANLPKLRELLAHADGLEDEAAQFLNSLPAVLDHAKAVAAGRPLRLKQLQQKDGTAHACLEATDETERRKAVKRFLDLYCGNASSGMHESAFLGASLFATFFVPPDELAWLNKDIQRTVTVKDSALYKLLGRTATFGTLGCGSNWMSIPSDELLRYFQRLLACDVYAGVRLSINELGRTLVSVEDQKAAGLDPRARATKFALDFDCKLPDHLQITERGPDNITELKEQLRRAEDESPESSEVYALRNKIYGNWEFIQKFVVAKVASLYQGIDAYCPCPPKDHLNPKERAWFEKFQAKIAGGMLDAEFFKGRVGILAASNLREAVRPPVLQYMKQQIHNTMIKKTLVLGCSPAPARKVGDVVKYSCHMVFFHLARHVNELAFMARYVYEAIRNAPVFEWSSDTSLMVNLDQNLYGTEDGRSRRLHLRPNFVFKPQDPPQKCRDKLGVDERLGATCLCKNYQCFRFRDKINSIQRAAPLDPEANACALKMVVMGDGTPVQPEMYIYASNCRGAGKVHAIFNELCLTSIATFTPLPNASDNLNLVTKEYMMSGFFTNKDDGFAADRYNEAFLHKHMSRDIVSKVGKGTFDQLIAYFAKTASRKKDNDLYNSCRGGIEFKGLPKGSEQVQDALIAWVTGEKNKLRDTSIAGWSKLSKHADEIMDDTYIFRHARIKKIQINRTKQGEFSTVHVYFNNTATPCYNLEHRRVERGQWVCKGCRGSCHTSVWFTSFLSLKRHWAKPVWIAEVQCNKDAIGSSPVFQVGRHRATLKNLLRPPAGGTDGPPRKNPVVDKNAEPLTCKVYSKSPGVKHFEIHSPGGWFKEIDGTSPENEAAHELAVQQLRKRHCGLFGDDRPSKQARVESDKTQAMVDAITSTPPTSANVGSYATFVGQSGSASWTALSAAYDARITMLAAAGRDDAAQRCQAFKSEARRYWM